LEDKEQLILSLPSNANIIFGDIEETIGPFIEKIRGNVPVGFASIDVDFYSSTVSALKLFDGSPECYLPVELT